MPKCLLLQIDKHNIYFKILCNIKQLIRPPSKAVGQLIAEMETKFPNLKELTGTKKKTLPTEHVQIDNETVHPRAQSKVGLYSRTQVATP